MSDIHSSIVPVGISKAEVIEKMDRVIKYLVSQEIISSEQTDSVLGSDLGYPPAKNYGLVMQEGNEYLLELRTNGLGIKTGRNVYYADGIYALNCPNCKSDMLETDWSAALDEWMSESPNDQVVCPECNQFHSVSELVFSPNWGFGEIGFTFWNWGRPFNQIFIDEMEKVLGCKTTVIYGKL